MTLLAPGSAASFYQCPEGGRRGGGKEKRKWKTPKYMAGRCRVQSTSTRSFTCRNQYGFPPTPIRTASRLHKCRVVAPYHSRPDIIYWQIRIYSEHQNNINGSPFNPILFAHVSMREFWPRLQSHKTCRSCRRFAYESNRGNSQTHSEFAPDARDVNELFELVPYI